MALVITNTRRNFVGNQVEVTGDAAFDSTYPTGGEAVSLAELGISRLDDLKVENGGGYTFAWDGSTTAPKILAYWTGAGLSAVLAQVTNNTNLAAVTGVKVTARGV